MLANVVFVAALVGSAAALAPRQYASVSSSDDSFESYSLDASQSSEAACDSMLASAASGVPSFPADVESYFASYLDTPITDPCQITVPSSLAAVYSSYMTPYSSWYAEHSSAIYSIESRCGYLDPVSSSYYYSDVCATATSNSASAKGSATGTATATATATGKTTAAATDKTTAKATTTATSTATGTTGTATGTATGTTSATTAAATAAAARDSASVIVGAVVAAAGFLVIAL